MPCLEAAWIHRHATCWAVDAGLPSSTMLLLCSLSSPELLKALPVLQDVLDTFKDKRMAIAVGVDSIQQH